MSWWDLWFCFCVMWFLFGDLTTWWTTGIRHRWFLFHTRGTSCKFPLLSSLYQPRHSFFIPPSLPSSHFHIPFPFSPFPVSSPLFTIRNLEIAGKCWFVHRLFRLVSSCLVYLIYPLVSRGHNTLSPGQVSERVRVRSCNSVSHCIGKSPLCFMF